MRAAIDRASIALLLAIALLARPAIAGEEAAPEAAPTDAPAAAAAEPAPAPAPGADPLFEEPSSEEYPAELGALVPDPIEPLNRKFFEFNDKVDQYLLLPVTNVYQFLVPSPVRASIRRAFRNIQAPIFLVNNLLQFRFRDAAETFGGFVLNTTAGVGGLFDPGAEVGWTLHPADFGQTLGVFGVKSGPYLVFPLLGPSTLRDGFGDLVDRAFDPLTYLLGMGDLIFIGGSSGFVTREANAKAIETLRSSSVDYYAAMRSAYTQSREGRIAQIRAHRCGHDQAPETAASEGAEASE